MNAIGPEDRRRVAGRAAYVADLCPEALACAFVRSPYPHARLAGIETATAARLPGVVAVLTGADLEADLRPVLTEGKGQHPCPWRALPADAARYAGEPVAVVVARTRAQAEDAADAVEVRYELLDAVAAAGRPGAPAVHAEAPDNVLFEVAFAGGEDPAELPSPAHVIEGSFRVPRQTALPLECRGVVAVYDAEAAGYTITTSTQIPTIVRLCLAAVLGVEPSRVRVITPEVGGGFGLKLQVFAEELILPALARRVGAPVKWIEDRREHLVATNHARQQVHEVELGATRDGRIVALTDRITVDMGAYLRTHGVSVPELTIAMLPGPYQIRNYYAQVDCVLTNKTPTGTYRSPGRFESNFVRERVMDLLAEATGLDPAEVRRRNFVAPAAMPWATGTFALGEPIVYDTGIYASTLESALEAIDYERRRRERQYARADGRVAGVGIACFVEKAGPGPWETARVTLDAGGRVTVYSGGASVGQGMETALAQICAQELGSTYDDVAVVHGDTATIPAGIGAWGSRVTVVGGAAVARAARELRRMVIDRAAARLEAAPGDLLVADSRVWVRGAPGRSLALREVVTDDRALEAAHRYEAIQMTYPYGAHAAVVEIDLGTGLVSVIDYAIAYDVGKAVNPMLVTGQMVGGLAQGIGGAILEELAYADDAQPLSVTFMDYLMPTSLEMPARVAVRILEETPTPLNPLGVKGAGEGGTAAAGAAIANAVADALRPLGVDITDLPLSPSRVVALIAAASEGRSPAREG